MGGQLYWGTVEDSTTGVLLGTAGEYCWGQLYRGTAANNSTMSTGAMLGTAVLAGGKQVLTISLCHCEGYLFLLVIALFTVKAKNNHSKACV